MTGNALKLAVAMSDRQAARQLAGQHEGVLFSSNSETTGHLPFAALFIGVTDEPETFVEAGDAGVFLVCERTVKHRPLSELTEEQLPGAVGLFPMVANPGLGPRESDRYWRDNHAPLALEVHETMTHYYQLSIVHRFSGPDWDGIAVCCCASEDDLRHRFYNSKEGERRIIKDISCFADTKKSPRRVIAVAEKYR